MATLAEVRTLDSRLMKAADCLIQHGELIEVVYVGTGTHRLCRLIGRGVATETVVLAIWAETGRRIGGRDVRFDEVALPMQTAVRLEAVAREQEDAPRERGVEPRSPIERNIFHAPIGCDTGEMARTMEFIAAVIANRGRRRDPSGRYAGHHCEPAGRR